MRLLLIIVILFGSQIMFAQTNNQSPCSSPETHQFDFWMGEWNLTWNDSLHGTNHVEKIFGNCTIQENFAAPYSGLLGKSWSVFNKNYKVWQQTWVDNQGGYTEVSGGMQGDSMVLTTMEKTVPKSVSPTGKLINRMVYSHITSNTFDWSWESSADGGITWKSNWFIHYKRK